jgi:DNA-binding response OmpR family regulator
VKAETDPVGGAVRVLVAEDEEQLASSVARGLRQEGMAVDVALDGVEALKKARVSRYDVVILDRDLPELHGDVVCRALAGGQSESRIMMLTAAGDLEDLIDGLSLGADDYLAKPFSFRELVARIRALARRTAPAVPPVLEGGGIVLDPARRTITSDGRPLDLTPKEFAVLEVLLAASGAVVSARDLVERVWDEHADPFTNSLRMTVMKLRRKLERPQVIETIPGVGYRLAT